MAVCVLIWLILYQSTLGYFDISLKTITRILFSVLTGARIDPSEIDAMTRTVVVDVRLPRILTAACVGCGLSISGAVFQGILHNPLADPYTLGISAGAAFGASIGILGIPDAVIAIPICAFAGAIISLSIVIAIAESAPRTQTGYAAGTLILAGILVSTILSAGISFMKFLADDQVEAIIFWLMGSFSPAGWTEAGWAFFASIAGFFFFQFHARELNILSLGTMGAVSLGVQARAVSIRLLVAASLLSALCVALSGIIGFVGLLVPHLARFLCGPDHSRLIPLSATFGAILLMTADSVTRTALPVEVPIGVFTALLGGPFFCGVFVLHHRWLRRGKETA
ncbi:MAG: iron ABC transporter permease [Deltaproteobacteria bacterium]|nr:MAG: iron ABC transporter permease [Deltaproteobacteria bacterium]